MPADLNDAQVGIASVGAFNLTSMSVAAPEVRREAGACHLQQTVQFKDRRHYEMMKRELALSSWSGTSFLAQGMVTGYEAALPLVAPARIFMSSVLQTFRENVVVPNDANQSLTLTAKAQQGCDSPGPGYLGSLSVWKVAVGLAGTYAVRIGMGLLLTAALSQPAETAGVKVVAGCVAGMAGVIIAEYFYGFPDGTGARLALLAEGCAAGVVGAFAGPTVDAITGGLRTGATAIGGWLARLGVGRATQVASEAVTQMADAVGRLGAARPPQIPCYTCTTIGLTSTTGTASSPVVTLDPFTIRRN
jgi:hypothetical protein